MGCHSAITAESFPKQSDHLNARAQVVFHYDLNRRFGATIVRDDVESPFMCILKLDDGRYVLSGECQYSPQHA